MSNFENKTERVDIMVDIETLGKGYQPPVFQISAAAFDITTGEIFNKFNQFANPKSFTNIEGDTLLWWLNTNSELLKRLLSENSNNAFTEKDLIKSFVNWIIDMQNETTTSKDIYLWGNGELFDNRIMKEKCNQYGFEYPVFYRNDRDMRTLTELAAIKKGLRYGYEFCNDYGPKNPEVHNAMNDVIYQVATASLAYKTIIDNKGE